MQELFVIHVKGDAPAEDKLFVARSLHTLYMQTSRRPYLKHSDTAMPDDWDHKFDVVIYVNQNPGERTVHQIIDVDTLKRKR